MKESRLSWEGIPNSAGSSTSAWRNKVFCEVGFSLYVMSGLALRAVAIALARRRLVSAIKRGERQWGAGARGLGRCSEGSLQLKLSRPLERPMKLKKRTTTHTEMQTATFTGIPPVLAASPRNHLRFGLASVHGTRVTFPHRTLVRAARITTRRGRDIFGRIVEAVGEIRHADSERQLDDLSFVVEFAQVFQFGGAKSWSRRASRDRIEDVAFSFSSNSGLRL